jgi:hypothetical protein
MKSKLSNMGVELPLNPGGASSYILVYTDVPLEWGTFLTSEIYQWGAIFIICFINGYIILHAIISMGGKFVPGIYYSNYTVMKYMTGSGFSTEIYVNGYGFQKY